MAEPASERTILHVDMDAFYAAVEQLDRPELRGKPVLVGSDRRRGVVATASYEARVYGCRSAQPMAVARRLCPHAIVVPPRGARYLELSRRVFALFRELTPLVQGISIDEAFLDLTGTEELHGPAVDAARALRRRILEETGLTASVGVAPNKFLAKLASDRDKPDGLVVVTEEDLHTWLPGLSASSLPGVGPAAAARLRSAGIETVGDLRDGDLAGLRRRLGRDADRLHRLAHGLDDRAVVPEHTPKSLGHEQTFEYDLERPEDVRGVLFGQAERVARRVRSSGLLAAGVAVKIRFGNYETITRSARVDPPSATTRDLAGAARRAFDRFARAGFRPVRLIGVSASPLVRPERQLGLFVDPRAEREEGLDRALDRIVERFGAGAIGRAAGARRRRSTGRRRPDPPPRS